ncbi:M23 family metallopeptidase [Bacteroidales bacterium OttesenSCG-928-B11]|nr:M23 family metallopeptidase [Bacteroidales bacterium OttesenSCG-928-B11]MDL2325734.1 M23 family metallopeptidase [Bacteroidales bacterium OttesenSCG-928-A14]
MKIINNISYFFKAIKRNWKTKYRLLIQNTLTHQNRISILLSPRNIFVLLTTSIFILVVITILLIAFTPLKFYFPGYARPEDYSEYRKLAESVDSLENKLRINQQYIANFYHVLNDQIIEDEKEMVEINNKVETKEALKDADIKKRLAAKERIFEDAEMIQEDVIREGVTHSVSVPVGKKTEMSSLLLLPPTHGVIAERFDPVNGQMGIVIKNQAGTLISAAADGVIISAGYDPKGGNTIIIQHANNLVSIYAHCENILKGTAQKVKSGEPIAKMGDSGQTTYGTNLYFELWYNGIQVNPLDYVVLN